MLGGNQEIVIMNLILIERKKKINTIHTMRQAYNTVNKVIKTSYIVISVQKVVIFIFGFNLDSY